MNGNVIRKSSYLEKYDIEEIRRVAIEQENETIVENLKGIEEEYVMNIFEDDLDEALDFINSKVYSDKYERDEVIAEYIKEHFDETKEEFAKVFNEKISKDEKLMRDLSIEEVDESTDYSFLIYNHKYELDDVSSSDFDEDCKKIFAIVNNDDEFTEEYFDTIDEFEKEVGKNRIFDVARCYSIYENDIADIITGETESVESLVDFCISELT